MVGRIREGVVAGVLRTVIGRGGIVVCPGVSIIGGTRGSGVVKGWGRVGGRVVVTGVEGMMSRWEPLRRAGSDILRWSMAESGVG